MTEFTNPRIEDIVLKATFSEHAAGGTDAMVAQYDSDNKTVSIDGGDYQPIDTLDAAAQDRTASTSEPLNQPLSLGLDSLKPF